LPILSSGWLQSIQRAAEYDPGAVQEFDYTPVFMRAATGVATVRSPMDPAGASPLILSAMIPYFGRRWKASLKNSVVRGPLRKCGCEYKYLLERADGKQAQAYAQSRASAGPAQD
jgi:hypothetical protein